MYKSKGSPSGSSIYPNSNYSSEPNRNDPLQSISSGKFSDMQFNKPPAEIYLGYVQNQSPQKPKSNTPDIFVEKSTTIYRSAENYFTEDDSHNSPTPVLPPTNDHGHGIKLKFLIRKKHILLILLFLLVVLLYGSTFGELLRKVSGVLKSEADMLPNFVMHHVPMIPSHKGNRWFCLDNKACSNFCNITEKTKSIAISKAAEKTIEQTCLPVQNGVNCYDLKFILSEHTVPFETQFLAAMRKMAYNDSRTNTDAQKIIKYVMREHEKNDTAIDSSIMEKNDVIIAFKKILKELMLYYDAFKAESFDFASESAGGKILTVKETETYFETDVSLKKHQNSPENAIQSGMQPGQCWAFEGSQGTLVVQLAYTIYPTGFTIEHIPVSLSPSGSIDSAPRNFSLWGLMSENDYEGKPLGQYSYDSKEYSLQYFPIQNALNHSFRLVELRIHSNHGNSKYTCLYRFRVHGRIDKQAFDKTVVF